ncbi:class I SAM-dependent DNA methyltransferase [Methylobacterium dankookense]|uniref:Malonyl-[acyl-carrier protein] O-methyltransferase n=1 Tax=Methylobacterium dankookense TaxID=560405 RepID=A0A564FU13_9HYPH|nr:methyltransferase domain-containing protein [Methylobacterium dankookense]GJD59840.1 Trans-aconitate 2-methyltransferase [Methylobacterium dankookense]VUF11354.1 Malonyl-[acyl-carrier protein] O-methyltransferase [Methylobacterium dankookense]
MSQHAASQHSSGDLLADRRYVYAEACLAEGDAAGAAEMAEQVIERAPRYAPAWLLLGRARECLHAATGAEETLRAARAAFETARGLDPEDRIGAGLHGARLAGGEGGESALSRAYVRALFDGYAGRFERHLVDGLGYCGPELLRSALDALPEAPARFGAALDLGCGTGLMGLALRDRVDELAGVDLSPAMLRLARAKGCYDRLAEGDLGPFLEAEPEASTDLCLAADVFIYLADLAPVLTGIARVLRPGGWAAFTVQSHDGSGVRLGEDGRYAHADAHVAEGGEAAGLSVVMRAPAAIRRERGRDVPGRIFVLRKIEL